MGVRGLTTYINNNQDVFLRRYYLHDSCLIIDGHSLCAQLYRSLNCFSAFGGDYDKFASYVKKFLKNLRKCKISPYVLFDGSYEARKLKTVYNRLRSKIKGASRLDPVTQNSLQIFPLLVRDVFIEVLLDMKIPFTVCEFEADDEIAAMARLLNCPILSYDSDFFIYNVLYIPFNTVDLKSKQIIINNEKVHVLECKIYKVEYLAKHFGGLNEELLPLLATLLGNDFVEKRVFRKFFCQLKLQKSRTKKNEQQKSIHALFKWLQNETIDSAIAKILGRLKKNKKQKAFYIIKKSIQGYHEKHCRSMKYFNLSDETLKEEFVFEMPTIVDENEDEDEAADGETDNEDDSESDTESEDDKEDTEFTEQQNDFDKALVENDTLNGMPLWLADGIRLNYIPKPYINLYTHHLYFCSPQAEDYTDKDVCLCVLPIMRYAFDILTDFSNENFVYVSRENNNNYQRIFVDKQYSILRLTEITYNELTNEQLNKYFYHFLNEKLPLIDYNTIKLLPPSFQLFMISLLWWVANCSVPIAHVHSLLMSYVYLEVIDEKLASFRGHNFFINKHSKKLEELKKRTLITPEADNELHLNKNKVQYEDCLIAASVLLKHFEIDESIRKRPKSYDVRRIHSFAQFQCCLMQFNYLNILCRSPFASTTYSKCYNGTFIYNVALKLENQIEPMNFIQQYLKGATSVLLFYKSILHIVNVYLNVMNLNTVQWSNKKKRSRRKKNSIDDEINKFLIEDFKCDVVI